MHVDMYTQGNFCGDVAMQKPTNSFIIALSFLHSKDADI